MAHLNSHPNAMKLNQLEPCFGSMHAAIYATGLRTSGPDCLTAVDKLMAWSCHNESFPVHAQSNLCRFSFKWQHFSDSNSPFLFIPMDSQHVQITMRCSAFMFCHHGPV